MQYFKRVFVLLVLIVIFVLSYEIKSELNTHFTLLTLGFLSLHIVAVLVIFFGFHEIKNVMRTKGIIIFECIGLMLMLVVSFYPQIDWAMTDKLSNIFGYKLYHMDLIGGLQIVFGYWLISFVMIFRNPRAKRNRSRGSVRYLG